MGNVVEALQGIADMYEEEVEKGNAKGFLQRYKDACDLFLNLIKQAGFSAKNIEFLDGYFIFGRGDYTIIHFNLDECPGWKFGVWWEEPTSDSTVMHGRWFGQYEETIDKFKPSASVFEHEFSLWSGDQQELDWEILGSLKFIRDEPALAFCRDYLMWNYNMEYHTREEAQQEYQKYLDQKALEELTQREYDDYCYNKLVQLFKANMDICDHLYLCDSQGHWGPRYEFLVYQPDGKGEYNILDLEGGDDVEADLEDKYQEAVKQNIFLSENYSMDFNIVNEPPTDTEYFKLIY